MIEKIKENIVKINEIFDEFGNYCKQENGEK